MGKHGLNQQANDWLICDCGKLFSDSRKKKRTKWEKYEEHILENLSE